MPIFAIVFLIIVMCVAFACFMSEKIVTGSLCSGAIIIGLILWIGYASDQDTKVKSVTVFKVHKSPDEYQYVTVNNEPLNVTKLFGHMLGDEYSVERTEYEVCTCGIDFMRSSTTTGRVTYKPVKSED